MSDSSKKRRGFESDICQSTKRARLGIESDSIEEPSASFGPSDNLDALDFLSQLDFNIPPAVSLQDNMNAGKSLSISMFDGAKLVNTVYEEHFLNEIGDLPVIVISYNSLMIIIM